jgi:hypothetical protein
LLCSSSLSASDVARSCLLVHASWVDGVVACFDVARSRFMLWCDGVLGDQCVLPVGYAFGATRKPSGHGFLDFPGLFA